MEIKEETSETFIMKAREINNQKKNGYQKYFTGAIELPCNLEKTFELVTSAKTWEQAYRLVTLKFNEDMIRKGLTAKARAAGENVPADYEVVDITKDNSRIVVDVKLSETTNNKENKIFFEKMQAKFEFEAVETNKTRFFIHMWFDKKSNGYKQFLSNMVVSPENLMIQGIDQSLNVFHRKASNPNSFLIEEKIEQEIKIENTTIGICLVGNYQIPESAEKLYNRIIDFDNCDKIFPSNRFKYNPNSKNGKNIFAYKTPIGNVSLDLISDPTKQKIIFQGNSSDFLVAQTIGTISLGFQLQQSGDNTICTLRYYYEEKSLTNGAIKFLTAEDPTESIQSMIKMTIATILRRLYYLTSGIENTSVTTLNEEDKLVQDEECDLDDTNRPKHF